MKTRKSLQRLSAPMSALGQKRTFAPQKVMSALPPKADMCDANRDVRFGPKADIGLTALVTKTHGRSRKRLIGRLLNTAKHNGTKNRDCGCRNAGKEEGSHKQPSLCLHNGSIGTSRNGLYSHCPKRRI